MGSVLGQTDKATLERDWANAEARLKLNKLDKASWSAMGHTIRPHVYYDKILVVWQYAKGQPQVKDIFTTVAVDGSFQDGLWVMLRSKITGHESVVTHTPQRLTPDLEIFAWVPFFNEVRFVSQDWNNVNLPRNLRMGLCLKMREDPRKVRLREGVDYLSELHVFRETFPQYSDTRF